MSKLRLPDFLIIGTPKSGTTSLYHYLKAHPGVWLPRIKEPHWFVFDGPAQPRMGGPYDAMRRRELIRSWDAYQALFASCPAGRVCGEASVRYLYSDQACRAIHQRVPRVRLIVILRQPAERAYSAYQRDRVHGREPCPTFAGALADGPRRECEGWWIGAQQSLGFYAKALDPWLETFDRQQLRVYLYDDLVDDPAGLIRDLYAFIGVDDAFVPDLTRRYNVTGPLENPLADFLWRGTRCLRSHLVPMIPIALRGLLAQFESHFQVRKVRGETLDPALRASLTELYRDDIVALGSLIGRDLGAWLEPARGTATGQRAAADADMARFAQGANEHG